MAFTRSLSTPTTMIYGTDTTWADGLGSEYLMFPMLHVPGRNIFNGKRLNVLVSATMTPTTGAVAGQSGVPFFAIFAVKGEAKYTFSNSSFNAIPDTITRTALFNYTLLNIGNNTKLYGGVQYFVGSDTPGSDCLAADLADGLEGIDFSQDPAFDLQIGFCWPMTSSMDDAAGVSVTLHEFQLSLS